MLISELTRHYNSNANSSKKNSAVGTKGIERLTSSVRELGAGNIFEGTVNSVKNGQVVLGLSNGTQLTARLDGSVQLTQGQSLFFEVKSNDGTTIAIRPYTIDGEGANPTILNALKAANLSAESKYLNMVNAMMQEQMPIDKHSMMQMARILMANPDVNVQTLVQMKKLEIPITPELISQFENYKDDSSAIHSAIDRFITEFPSMLGNSDLSLEQTKSLDSQFLMLLADGEGALWENLQKEQPFVRDSSIQNINIESNAIKNSSISENVASTDNLETIEVRLEQPTEQTQEILDKITAKQDLLSLIKYTFGDIGIKADDSSAVLLQKLANYIANGNVSKPQLLALFSNKEMTSFLQGVMKDQFLLSPKEMAEAEQVKGLYERLQTKMNALDTLLQNMGIKEQSISQTLQDIRGNIQFMNQVNEAYTFMQIPLKMSNQNASGQLYVYTNKRDIGNPEKELTAFLHLDLEHLGETDVSVKMFQKEVNTKFYMESDESFAIMEEHMPILEERLRKKGYNCKVEIVNEGKHINFVEDFLKKDAPSGQLHRYSFDVRA